MFEKSLYDLIRGLRHHKGNERDYILNSLRECRAEIRGQDMDVKATALLKLVYLEMFGHDMSWAAFHVLEVMSSAKFFQKRVGYLGAVQSFRPDTEVLMLATNLLKKDIGSSSVPIICSSLVTVPHIVTPSLALSLLSDLMPRLSHSSPTVRKKTLVTLYRLALVYPEALRSAWPKIKEILMDEQEDPSVIAATINIVCELGWRRPRDFLPLAPRFFDLLVDGGNNWMSIKIIKLFAILTPLEPRLIKKLLPPLTNLIRTTPAMSLLYECIHGIIQGGILSNEETFRERDEIAELCVSKLQEMIAMEGDPNLKYVALLSFNKVVETHPHLVVSYQDVILDCINDPDISIRFQALELGSRMVNADNLEYVVARLMQQLRESLAPACLHSTNDTRPRMVEPAADSDGEDPSKVLVSVAVYVEEPGTLPEEYRSAIVARILDMCSKNTYGNVTDFEWYLDTLLDLVKYTPSTNPSTRADPLDEVSDYLGSEIRNVAVRVVAVRPQAVHMAALLLSPDQRHKLFPAGSIRRQGVIPHAIWIVGEYANSIRDPTQVLESLLQLPTQELDSRALCSSLQSIPKLLCRLISDNFSGWSLQQQSVTSLLLARVTHFLEQLTAHSDLEVQERAVGYLELFRITSEAVSSYGTENRSPPLLLSSILPSLFGGFELGPVAASAQRKVPPPSDLNLSAPINHKLSLILSNAENQDSYDDDVNYTRENYQEKPAARSIWQFTADLPPTERPGSSYQNVEKHMVVARDTRHWRLERQQQLREDPFYIPGDVNVVSTPNTSIDDILRSSNGEEIDIDSIPIMDLDLGTASNHEPQLQAHEQTRKRSKVYVTEDENIESEAILQVANLESSTNRQPIRKGLLQVDSSNLRSFSLGTPNHLHFEATKPNLESERDDVAMTKALAEVERLRMEMQRASEQVQAQNIPREGSLVKKKTKKKRIAKSKQETSVNANHLGEKLYSPTDLEEKEKKKKKKAAPNTIE